MKIPRIIHQTVPNKQDIPAVLLTNISHLKQLNGNWEHRLYDNQDFRKFIYDHYGHDMLRSYDRINPLLGVAKADFFRYLLLYKIGGVYLDIKSTITQKLDDIIDVNDTYLLSHWRNKPGERYEGWGLHPDCDMLNEYQQWHIIASPNHPFLEAAILKVKKNIEKYDLTRDGVGRVGVLNVTGPVAYTLAIESVMKPDLYKLVDIEELGFKYSILETPDHPKAHERLFLSHYGYHYSRVSEPVVMPQAFDRNAGLIEYPKVLRKNIPCPCGSGKTYKHCHGIQLGASKNRFVRPFARMKFTMAMILNAGVQRGAAWFLRAGSTLRRSQRR